MKEKYMEELKNAIADCSKAQQAEIIADFEEHFSIGLQHGHSEQEIIDSLGPINEFIEELVVKEEKQELQVSDAITKVIVSSQDGDVEISRGSQLNTELTNYNKASRTYYTFNQEEIDGVLYIELKRKPSVFGRFGSAPTIKLTLTDAQSECGVKANNGDIGLSDAVLSVCSLSSLNGDIEVNGVISNLRTDTKNGDIQIDGKIENVIADSKNGDIEVNCEGVAEDVEVRTSHGDIGISGAIQNVLAQTDMGDIECVCESSLSISLITSMGDIDLDVAKLDSFEIKAKKTLGEIEVDLDEVTYRDHLIVRNEGLTKINVASSMGDIEIHE